MATPGPEYIAGFADADGSFSIVRATKTGQLNPIIEICNTDDNVLNSIQTSLVEYGIRCAIYSQNLKNKNINWKSVFHLRVTGCKNVLICCKLIRQYLILKAPRADILIRYCSIMTSNEKYDENAAVEKLVLFGKLRLLNKRGCKEK